MQLLQQRLAGVVTGEVPKRALAADASALGGNQDQDTPPQQATAVMLKQVSRASTDVKARQTKLCYHGSSTGLAKAKKES